jgi:hypothetical protein
VWWFKSAILATVKAKTRGQSEQNFYEMPFQLIKKLGAVTCTYYYSYSGSKMERSQSRPAQSFIYLPINKQK